MNDLVIGLVAKHFFNLACMQSFDLIQLLRAVIDQATREFQALKVEATHAFANAEVSTDFPQAGRKQALAFLHQCLMSALIDDDLARRL